MKLPPLGLPEARLDAVLNPNGWRELTLRSSAVERDAGFGDVFKEAADSIRAMAEKADFHQLPALLKKRVYARALTKLWIDEDRLVRQLLNPTLLNFLIQAQRPRLGRLALLNIASLFFKYFDELSNLSNQEETDFFETYSEALRQQLALLPAADGALTGDTLEQLRLNRDWIISRSGPMEIVKRTRASDTELEIFLRRLGLADFIAGRFGDVCRSHYYLETLKEIPVGADDAVLSELTKPSVSGAPFDEGRTIGLAALEIVIDRVTSSPSDVWLNFILQTAGDPRIQSQAKNYRQWWVPLGDQRVTRVKSWLAKGDLKLFLAAVDEYGAQVGNEELSRMFPARRKFLEGLLKQGFIRDSRLMLGQTAERIVKRILDDKLLASYVKLTNANNMSDKSVLYLDCGDFHLIEGSHNFQIWVYLAKPSEIVTNYAKQSLSHFELTNIVPREYRSTYAGLPSTNVIHGPQWQSKVIKFLADNGIALDIEALFSPKDYREFLQRHGMPVVRSRPAVKQQPQAASQAMSSPRSPELTNDELAQLFNRITASGHKVLDLLNHQGGKTLPQLGHQVEFDSTEIDQYADPQKKIVRLLNGELKNFVTTDETGRWWIRRRLVKKMREYWFMDDSSKE